MDVSQKSFVTPATLIDKSIRGRNSLLSKYDISDMPHGEYVERQNLGIKGSETPINSSVAESEKNSTPDQIKESDTRTEWPSSESEKNSTPDQIKELDTRTEWPSSESEKNSNNEMKPGNEVELNPQYPSMIHDGGRTIHDDPSSDNANMKTPPVNRNQPDMEDMNNDQPSGTSSMNPPDGGAMKKNDPASGMSNPNSDIVTDDNVLVINNLPDGGTPNTDMKHIMKDPPPDGSPCRTDMNNESKANVALIKNNDPPDESGIDMHESTNDDMQESTNAVMNDPHEVDVVRQYEVYDEGTDKNTPVMNDPHEGGKMNSNIPDGSGIDMNTSSCIDMNTENDPRPDGGTLVDMKPPENPSSGANNELVMNNEKNVNRKSKHKILFLYILDINQR